MISSTFKRTTRVGVLVLSTSILLLLASCDWSDSNDFSKRENVEDLILEDVIGTDTVTNDMRVFLGNSPLSPGAVIRPIGNLIDSIVIVTPTWFAWADDDPEAEFYHDTRYILVNATSGELDVFNFGWWPIINDSIDPFYNITDAEVDSLTIFTTL